MTWIISTFWSQLEGSPPVQKAARYQLKRRDAPAHDVFTPVTGRELPNTEPCAGKLIPRSS